MFPKRSSVSLRSALLALLCLCWSAATATTATAQVQSLAGLSAGVGITDTDTTWWCQFAMPPGCDNNPAHPLVRVTAAQIANYVVGKIGAIPPLTSSGGVGILNFDNTLSVVAGQLHVVSSGGGVLPPNAQLLGGTGSAFVPISVGSGLSLTGGLLSATGTGTSGFPIVIGSTSIAGSSTTTTIAGLTLTAPVLTGATLNVGSGSDAPGDLYYRSSGGALARLSIGTNGQVLTMVSGLPAWSATTFTVGTVPMGAGASPFAASEITDVGQLGVVVGAATGGQKGAGSINMQSCFINNVPCAAGSSTAFGSITGGTNTTAAMVVGTGASIAATGSGTINATSLNGATFAAPGAIGGTTPGAGTFTTLGSTTLTGTTLSGTFAGTPTYSGVPIYSGLASVTCAFNVVLDATNHLGTGTCPGAPAFAALTGGTNTTAAMLVGTGASLAATGSGTITATSMPASGLTGTIAAAQFPALTGPVTTVAGSLATSIAANAVTTSTINNSAVTYAKIQNETNNTLLGNTSGSAGPPSEVPVSTAAAANTVPEMGASGTLVSGMIPAINLAGSGAGGVTGALPATSLSGTVPAAQMPAFTGDVTSPAGSTVNTLATVNASPGTYSNATVTVNNKGLVTVATAGSAGGAASQFTGAVAGTNTYTSTGVPSGFALVATSPVFCGVFANANTGAATFNLNGTGAIAVQKQLITGNVALAGGELFGAQCLELNVAETAWLLQPVTSNVVNNATSQTITQAQWVNGAWFNVTGSGVTITLPVATSLGQNGQIAIAAIGNAVTLQPNAADGINGGAVGASVTIAAGVTAFVSTVGSSGTGALTANPLTGGAGGGVTSVTGTAGQVVMTGTTAVVASLPTTITQAETFSANLNTTCTVLTATTGTINTNAGNGNCGTFTLVSGTAYTLANPTGLNAGQWYNWLFTEPASGVGVAAPSFGTQFAFIGGTPIFNTANNAVNSISCQAVSATALNCVGGVGTTQIMAATNNTPQSAGMIGEEIKAYTPSGSATVTISIANPAVITWAGHAYNCSVTASQIAAGENCAMPIVFTTTGALPTGITSGTVYWVIGSSITASTFNVATSEANALAGTTLTTSGTQSGTHTGTAGVPITSGVATDIAAIQLGSGAWALSGNVGFAPAGTTTNSILSGWANSTSNAQPSPLGIAGAFTEAASFTAGAIQVRPTAPIFFRTSAAAPVYLGCEASFAVSTEACFGQLRVTRPY